MRTGPKKKDSDGPNKLLFSHPRTIKDLLLGFVREEWVHLLDFDSLEKMPASYVSDNLERRRDDVVWRVRFSGEWLYVYLLIEFQSTVDKFMPVRIMSYLGLLYQDLKRSKRLTADGKLPPVLPVVLYNGESRWNASLDIYDMITRKSDSLSAYYPKLQYLLIDAGAYSAQELESMKNMLAQIIRLETTEEAELTEEVLSTLLFLIWEDEELKRTVGIYLTNVYFENKVDVNEMFRRAKTPIEVKTMLEKNRERWVKGWIEQGRAEGHAEGRAKGHAEGRAEGLTEGERKAQLVVAKRLLKSGMSIQKIAEFTALSENEIQDLIDSSAH